MPKFPNNLTNYKTIKCIQLLRKCLQIAYSAYEKAYNLYENSLALFYLLI